MQLTPNLHFISNERRISHKKLKILPPQNNPLVVMPAWLLATDKQVRKYANFYLHRGFSVLNIRMDLWQLLWPEKGSQVLAGDILTFLENNRSSCPLIIHGFSIGCYLWGEVLVKVNADRNRFQFVLDNVIGQIWDSPADISRIPIGVPKATFPKNKFLQNTLQAYVIYHLRTFHDNATSHYLKSRNAFFDTPMRTPMLVYASKIDQISSEDTVQALCDYWKENGVEVNLKLWRDSLHVSHMMKYPKEYTLELEEYLKRIDLIKVTKHQSSL